MEEGVMPAVRPIGAAHNMITTPIAITVDRVLQGPMRSSDSFIPDSIEVLKKLQQIRLPANAILIGADIASMYPNVDTSIEASKRVMKVVRNYYGTDPSCYLALQNLSLLLRWCLNNHWVRGPGEKYHRQVNGLGTGSQFSPSYANIWWATYETPVIEEYKDRDKISMYLRFIDDIFAIMKNGNKEEAVKFIATLSQQHPNIKLEGIQIAEKGQSVTFLDLVISWDEDDYDPVTDTYGVKVKTHQKELNAYQYLPYHSHHPRWVLKNWIRGELERYVRTCTREEDYKEMVSKFKTRIMNRGYKEKEYENIVATVHHSSRQQLLEVKRKPPPRGDPIAQANTRWDDDRNMIIPLVVRYSSSWSDQPKAREYRSKIKNALYKASSVFPPDKRPTPLLAYSNSPTLHTILAKARSMDKTYSAKLKKVI